jgi:hypothetical protein
MIKAEAAAETNEKKGLLKVQRSKPKDFCIR